VTVNQRIIKIYKNLDISQYRFAKETGVSTATLNQIINNPEGKPSYETIQKILNRYSNLNANYLMSGKGQMWDSENISIDIPEISEKTIEDLPPQYEGANDVEYLKEALKLMERLCDEKERVIDTQNKLIDHMLRGTGLDRVIDL
jgi:transcriptional regulator with XRE-family HTH domain